MTDLNLLTKEEENRAMQMINLLELHEESFEFQQPVDYKRLGIPMYPIIIKNPMDLGTIRKRTKQHIYKSLHEFISDVQLVWENCKTYNDKGSVILTQEIYMQAEFLEKQTKRYCSKLRIPLPHATKNSKHESSILEDLKNVTFEEKWRITEAVRKLSQSALEKIVDIVTQKSPEAVENLDTEKIKIKLDSVSRETFNQLQEIVNEFNMENLPQKRMKKS